MNRAPRPRPIRVTVPRAGFPGLLSAALGLCLLPIASAPALASLEDSEETTLVVTLRGLPPPATPPPASHPAYPAYRQPPVQAPPAPAPRRTVIGRLGVCELHGAPIYRGRDG